MRPYLTWMLAFLLSLVANHALGQVDSLHSGQDTSKRGGRLSANPRVEDTTQRGKILVVGEGENPPAAAPEEPKEKKPRGEKVDKKPDSTFTEAYAALRRSLILPGWGQVYNGSWWKTPIVWGGFGALGFFIYDNQKGYSKYQAIYRAKVDTTLVDLNPEITETAARYERDQYRRLRDLDIILCVVWYGLNGLDAYVEGHLKSFDVSDNLSFKVKPSLQLAPTLGSIHPTVGASFTLRWKP